MAVTFVLQQESEVNVLKLKHRCPLVLWFSTEDMVTNTRKLMCMAIYSDRNYTAPSTQIVA